MSRCRRLDSSWGKNVMQQEEPGRGDPIGPLDWRQILPFEAAAASDQLGWVGLEAARCRAEPAFERSVPALTHHRLVLVTRPPVDLDLRYEGVKRQRPTPADVFDGHIGPVLCLRSAEAKSPRVASGER